MQTIAIVAMAVCLFVSASRAQVRLDVTTKGMSDYVVTNGTEVHHKPVGQADFWFTLPYGIWADLWGSTDFAGGENGGREVDYGGGWSDGKYVDFGGYYYDFSSLGSNKPFGDIVRLHAEIHHTIDESNDHTFVPYGRLEYLIATHSTQKNSAPFVHAGLRHRWAFSKRIFIAHQLAFIYDDGVFQGDDGVMLGYDASVGFKLTESITLLPVIIKLTTPVAGIDDRNTEPVIGSGLSVVFDLIKAETAK